MSNIPNPPAKCKNCGSEIFVGDGTGYYTCYWCDAVHDLSKKEEEKEKTQETHHEKENNQKST